MQNKLLLLILSSFLCGTASAQDTIRIFNASFDDDPPGCGKVPSGWTKIGKLDLLPDLQPYCHKVTTPAQDGSACLSLVATEDGDWQGVSTYLGDGVAIRRPNTYKMSVWVAYSKEMEQEVATGGKTKSFGKPAVLRIWGYNTKDELDELLAQTDILPTTKWTKYDFEIEPTVTDFEQLDFEVYYNPEKEDPYNGNILIDHISDIIRSTGQPETRHQIALENPSFEDAPAADKTPKGWINCGFVSESPTDIQPGQFEVTLPAMDGKTYVGMVIRERRTFESLGQKLKTPLFKDSTYVLTAGVAHSEKYTFTSRATGIPENFTGIARLRIWGGTESNCSRVELLAESPLIDNQQWKTVELKFKPQKHDYPYLILEAYYDSPEGDPYNGNLLIDNCNLYILR